MKGLKDKSKGGACPDEININRYVLNQCSSKERQKIEKHLAKCTSCRKEVVFLIQAQPLIQNEEMWGELPDRLYNKALAFVKRMTSTQGSSLDICIQFVHEKWQIIRHTGTLISQPALAVRGDESEKETPISTLVKEFNGYRVEADLKDDEEGMVSLQIRVKITEKGIFVPKVHFTLRDEKKQRILAEFTKGGTVSFDGITPGIYSIHIEEPKKVIGEINLDLRR